MNGSSAPSLPSQQSPFPVMNPRVVISVITGVALLALGALAITGFFGHSFLGTTNPEGILQLKIGSQNA